MVTDFQNAPSRAHLFQVALRGATSHLRATTAITERVMSETVLIVGAGNGLSASLGRKFYEHGMSIHLVARNIEKLDLIASEVNAGLYPVP